ncbi:3-oxoacyl-ACP synthase III family protein [Streptomyces sudanensis]|uniref:3-oxoacyl-ACP synthase III family protein n=1 Tax=Streptomyces sudanensis TaxID=436397 RepID=UPI0020CD5177|nr:3-oxoacyl-[acyl-carrier-protein] synthase III C-terminal domain-containing protein [Streptomyces sudanensis]MCP9958676.1 3-oxoacyl-ACP synthase [Streptomyces sudanensis]MCQ0000829.1 3-oxoacyl-ACP synthase [Streptomyces sudanensis]
MSGIADIEVVLPASNVSMTEVARTSGVDLADILKITHSESFPALAEGEPSWELAREAGRRILDRVGLGPDDVQQVIYAGSGEWDTPFWSPAAKVADELGIRRAHCYEIVNFCNAGLTAIRVGVHEILLGRAENVLVLIADRLSRMVDYEDPGSKSLFNFGDSAAAVLLSREPVAFRVLHSAMRTDPTWSDYYKGEIRDGRVVIRRDTHRPGLATAYVDNFTMLIDDTLSALGRKVSDIDHFLINQGDRSMHERLLRETGIPPERSVFHYHRLGHMGGADTMIALRGLLDRERLHRGDLVLLATSGMGFSWGITALEYQFGVPAARLATGCHEEEGT